MGLETVKKIILAELWRRASGWVPNARGYGWVHVKEIAKLQPVGYSRALAAHLKQMIRRLALMWTAGRSKAGGNSHGAEPAGRKGNRLQTNRGRAWKRNWDANV